MARLNPGERDLAFAVAETSLSAAGQTAWVPGDNGINFVIGGTGWVATIVLEASFDGGTTAIPVLAALTGAVCSYSAPCAGRVEQREAGVLYRLRVSAYTSGTIPLRLSA